MECTIDDVMKLELQVATVKAAEKVEGSEKLLRLELQLGDEIRQVVSGIAKTYNPEDMLGKQVVVIANLAPRTLFGLESKGMILCASGESGPIILSPEQTVPAGSSVQ